MTFAVSVPTIYDEYGPKHDQTWKVILWVSVACALGVFEFIILYLFGTEFVNLSPLLASVGAFLVTHLGNLIWLSARQLQ
jgi:hypothetical protein